jgi:hypothetical protein
MIHVKILNRRRYIYADKIKECEVSIEVMLITSLFFLVLFLATVSGKHHHQKGLKSHKQRIIHTNS